MNRKVLTIMWSAIAIILTLTMIIVISNHRGFFPIVSIFGHGSSNSEIPGEVTLDYTAKGSIEKLNLIFVNENIKILDSPDNTFRIEEISEIEIPENKKMRVSESNKTLTAQVDNNLFSSLMFYKHKTDINVYVPIGNKLELNISTASGDVKDIRNGVMGDVGADTISGNIELDAQSMQSGIFSTVSGNIDVNSAKYTSIDTDSVSGTILIDGAVLKSVNASSVSGDVTHNLSNTPSSISVSTTSGEVDIILPNSNGFAVEFDSVSGELNSEFSMTNNVHKDGSTKINVDTISGSCNILTQPQTSN